MPALVFHNYFCKQVLFAARKEIQDLISKNLGAFYLGAQGPDIFFTMYFDKNKRKELGNVLHQKKIYESFRSMVDYAKETRDPIFYSYLFGYICHYSLDLKIHPYVRYYDDVLYKKKGMSERAERHLRLESGFDLLVIRDELKGDFRKYHSVKNTFLSTKKEEKSIARFYSKVGAPLYGLDISEKKVLFCIKSTKVFFSLMHDSSKNRLKYRLADKIEDAFNLKKRFTGFLRLKEEAKEEDWFNLSRDSFPEIFNGEKTVNYTVPELAAEAKTTALSFFEEVYAALFNNGSILKESFSITFDGEKTTLN